MRHDRTDLGAIMLARVALQDGKSANVCKRAEKRVHAEEGEITMMKT